MWIIDGGEAMKTRKLDIVVSLVMVGLCLIVISLESRVEAGNTGKITGYVVDNQTGEGLPGAAVQIVGTTRGDLTDSKGVYEIINVPPGMYSLQIRLVGYKTKQVDSVVVMTDRASLIHCELESTSIETDVVQRVTAKQDVMEMSMPASNSVKTVDEMDAMSACRKPPHPRPKPEIQSATVGCNPLAHGGTTPPNGAPYDAMFFKHHGVNPFESTEDDNLSTFAVDIDDASYIMARTYLRDGHLPPEEAVRVEEFVNHFSYGYNPPRHGAFELHVDGSDSPFGKNYKLLRFGIKGRVVESENRKPAVLTFVIDVSGSMRRGDRLGLVKRSLRLLVDRLREDDEIGIVVYGSRGEEVLPHTSICNKNWIMDAIDRLTAGGSTYAEQGLVMGYEAAERNFKKGANNRVILCSDGVANVGRTGADDILKRIERGVKRGITLSSLGFGVENYNDVLLEKLGNRGNGYYAYIDNITEARKLFVDNLTGALEVVARDVKIQVEFDPDVVDRYRLIGFENRDVADEDFRDDTVDGGEIGSGHTCTALYEVRLKDRAHGEIGSIALRFKDPDTGETKEISRKIMSRMLDCEFFEQSPDFRLAAVAAEFGEVLRGSHWAKDSNLSNVLNYALELNGERGIDTEYIELIDLIAKASKLKEQLTER